MYVSYGFSFSLIKNLQAHGILMRVCSFFFHNLNQRNVIKLIFFSTGLKIFKLNFVSCTCTLNLTLPRSISSYDSLIPGQQGVHERENVFSHQQLVHNKDRKAITFLHDFLRRTPSLRVIWVWMQWFFVACINMLIFLTELNYIPDHIQGTLPLL